MTCVLIVGDGITCSKWWNYWGIRNKLDMCPKYTDNPALLSLSTDPSPTLGQDPGAAQAQSWRFSSGHTTWKWRRINVDATWSRRIDVDTTSFRCCVPARLGLGKKHTFLQLPSKKGYESYDLQEKRGYKCECKLECKHLLDSDYACDISACTCMDVTSRRSAICPVVVFIRRRH